jgi:hypothetical protein
MTQSSNVLHFTFGLHTFVFVLLEAWLQILRRYTLHAVRRRRTCAWQTDEHIRNRVQKQSRQFRISLTTGAAAIVGLSVLIRKTF